MREIKFKAWDKKNKKFWDSNTFSQGTYWSISNEGFVDATEKNVCRESYDFELLQFTGLKDKNGKEIYEGDIMLAEGNTNIYFLVEYGDDTDKENFGFTLSSLMRNKIIYGFCRDVERYEVIGNIYENPELLEDLK